MPRIGPMLCPVAQHVIVFLRATDAGRLHPHRGGKVGRTKAHRLQARAGGGDLFDVGDACGRFDNHLERDFLGAALRGFDRRNQRVDSIYVSGAADFGDHDLIQTLARLLQQVDDIAVPVRCIQPVDPHGQCFVAPVYIADRLDDIGAGAVLVCGGDAVFQIKVDYIGVRACHFFEDCRARTGTEQLAAVGTCRCCRLDAKAHMRNP